MWKFVLAALICVSCKEVKESKDTNKPAVEFQDCDVWLNGIHFTKMINDADKQVTEQDGIIIFTSPENTDIFNDPGNGGCVRDIHRNVLHAGHRSSVVDSGVLRGDITADSLDAVKRKFIHDVVAQLAGNACHKYFHVVLPLSVSGFRTSAHNTLCTRLK